MVSYDMSHHSIWRKDFPDYLIYTLEYLEITGYNVKSSGDRKRWVKNLWKN